MTFQYDATRSARDAAPVDFDNDPDIVKVDSGLSEEDLILECLGAAVIMRWDSLSIEDQREMLKEAFPLAGLAKTGLLKDHVANFLHSRTATSRQYDSRRHKQESAG